MRIKAVRLENIRSHKDTMVNFEKGFNCLIGGLGAGKTSILYAIDFALFGEPLGRSYAYLLREGENRARVTLWLEHEGSEYVIIRGLRRHGASITQDLGALRFFKNGRVIAEKRASSVAEQLEKELGLNSELFREVMWVRQEKLKEILDMGPRDRQRKLDALFGLSDFEEAWTRLREFESYYKRALEVYERDPDILAAAGLEEEHAKLVEELASLSARIEDLALEVDKAAKDVEEARVKLAELEEARRKLEKLREKKAGLEASIREARRTIERLSGELEAGRKRLEDLEKQLRAIVDEGSSLRNSLEACGLSLDTPLPEVEKALAELGDEIEAMKEKAIRTQQDVDAIRRRLEVISKESICPTCLRFIDESYRRDLTTKLKKELVGKEHGLRALRERLRELEERHNALSRALDALKILEARKTSLKQHLEEEKALLEERERELDSAKMRLDMLQVELESVSSKIDELRELGLEEARAELDEKTRRLHQLQAELEKLEGRRELVREKLADCERRLKLAEEKRRKAEVARKMVEVIRLLRSAYRSIQPHLRTEIVRAAKFYVQRVLDEISGPEGSYMVVEIGQDYTPVVKVDGRERPITHLSGGERTLLALAYRIGLGILIMQMRGSRPFDVLLLDEPTESLGREDLSIDKMVDALSRLKTVEQVIAVTHSEAFAEKADHVIRVEKSDNISRVRAETRPGLRA